MARLGVVMCGVSAVPPESAKYAGIPPKCRYVLRPLKRPIQWRGGPSLAAEHVVSPLCDFRQHKVNRLRGVQQTAFERHHHRLELRCMRADIHSILLRGDEPGTGMPCLSSGQASDIVGSVSMVIAEDDLLANIHSALS